MRLALCAQHPYQTGCPMRHHSTECSSVETFLQLPEVAELLKECKRQRLQWSVVEVPLARLGEPCQEVLHS